jgi:hypothetical protein
VKLDLSPDPWQPVIVFTVGGRMTYLLDTLDSWSRVRGIDRATMIFLVEPREHQHSGIVFECLEARHFARQAIVSVNPTLRGVLANPWHAMQTGFRQSGFVILAEEDTPVSADVLEYFGWASHEYLDDPAIWAVCAHQIGEPLGGPELVIRSRHFSPVVWGTWSDRWARRFRDSWQFDYSQRGWDWNINRLMGEDDGLVLIPARSRSQHIGQHGGAHTTAEMFADTQSWSFEPDYPPGLWAVAEWYQHHENRHDGQTRQITSSGGLVLPGRSAGNG